MQWDKDNFNTGIMIYTDGSCYKDMVGASAVLYIDGVERDSLKYQLGSKHSHTVFEGELVGIILGSHLAEAHPRPAATTNFSIDNQAAIQSMQNNSRQPAQYLIDEIHRCTEVLQRSKTARQQQQEENQEEYNPDGKAISSISFTWVAGHEGSTGNERSDTLAKEAAQHGSSPIEDLPTFLHQRLPASISAIKQSITADIKRQVKEWWRRSPRSIKMRHIDPSLPSDNYLKITNKLNRRQTSLLTQLRTGHAPLNK